MEQKKLDQIAAVVLNRIFTAIRIKIAMKKTVKNEENYLLSQFEYMRNLSLM